MFVSAGNLKKSDEKLCLSGMRAGLCQDCGKGNTGIVFPVIFKRVSVGALAFIQVILYYCYDSGRSFALLSSISFLIKHYLK